MFVLSRDGNRLVNFNNVASIAIQSGTIYPDTMRWNIRAMYPAVSHDILYDTLGDYHTEAECRNAFNKLCSRIVSGKDNEVIDMKDL